MPLNDIPAKQVSLLVGLTGLDSDGAETETIGSVNRRLMVDANLSGEIVPTITNKLRFRTNIGDVALPNTGVYQTLFSYTGSGLFFGFQTGFDNAKVKIKLTIDGGQVFDLLLDDIKKFEFNDTTTTRCQAGAFLTTIGNVLDFSSRFAIPYESSVLLQAASNDGANHKNLNWITILTEDT